MLHLLILPYTLGIWQNPAPRRMLGWVKRRRFDLLSAFTRGVSSGILWLIKDGRRGDIYISSSGTERRK